MLKGYEVMVEIPKSLIDAVREQRSVLFLGAGASHGAKHPNKKQIPLGDSLRDEIRNKFIGKISPNAPLSLVASIATNEAGLSELQEYIYELFKPFEPASHHLLIPTFRWRAIATTNFDLILEKAYRSPRVSPKQTLVKTIKNGDRLDNRINQTNNPLAFYKLHGCIESYADQDNPLVLGEEQYVRHKKNRDRLFNRFRDLGYEYPIIFAGYSISDSHLKEILFDLTDPNITRPPFYYVTPVVSEAEKRYYESLRIHTIEATFEDFLNEIDNKIPDIARTISTELGGGHLSIRKYYRISNAKESDTLKNYLDSDISHVYNGMPTTEQDAKEFYQGYDTGWGCVSQDLDVYRTFTDSVLVDAVLHEDSRKNSELFLLKGPGGNGKTVSLKRIAWEAGIRYNKLVFFNNNPAGLRIEPLDEIHTLTKERIFIFVDRVSLVRDELEELLDTSQKRKIPLTVIGAERDNEWNIYCAHLERFVQQEFQVRNLNEKEIDALLGLLERYNALGQLKNIVPDERKRQFIEGADRQLLVALHETTLGIPFEDIVVDEFNRIEPEVARNLYLDICTLHQFDLPVRAGLISRVSGINFVDFEKNLLKPLEKVVHTFKDNHKHEVYYRSRHQHVAEIVFTQKLPQPEERFDFLIRLIEFMNIEYSSDFETFNRLVKGRSIIDMFPTNIDLGRLFFDKLLKTSQNEPFVFHQRAVFEMHHSDGELNLAKEAADKAYELNSKSPSIQHTQAEISRRMANKTDDPLLKKIYRKSTRNKLGENSFHKNEYFTVTRIRLAIDEFKELLTSHYEPNDTVLKEGAKETEYGIQRGLQIFPDSTEILALEAEFRRYLNQSEKAKNVLERAFSINPRQDWIAVRLVRMYLEIGDVERSIEILRKCLDNKPDSKMAHFELGKIYIRIEEKERTLHHLSKSFTKGDSNFEAQFWYARELFLQGNYDKAKEMFSALHEKSPGRFKTRATACVNQDGTPIRYKCHIERYEEGYAFLKLNHFPENIFASRTDSEISEWNKLDRGVHAQCSVSFTRRGPRATSIETVAV